jgi:Flp pilus assembly protein TadB
MGRIMRRTFVAAFIVAAACVAVAGQQQTREATNNERARRVEPAAISGTQNAGENVDENFELNIAERRITEHDFFASTAIETGADAAHGLSLRVGVTVGASEIDVLLRNVQGRVRFRGSLDALRRVLDARRETNATTPQSVP